MSELDIKTKTKTTHTPASERELAGQQFDFVNWQCAVLLELSVHWAAKVDFLVYFHVEWNTTVVAATVAKTLFVAKADIKAVV